MIQPVFRSIKIMLKNNGESLSVLINQNRFSINRKSWVRFLKKIIFDLFKSLFQTPFSLSDSDKHNPQFFVGFDQIFCKVFLSQGRYVHYTLSFSFISSFSCIEGLFSNLAYFGVFFCEIDHWVFVLWCYKHDPCGLIWSILWFLRNWKF